MGVIDFVLGGSFAVAASTCPAGLTSAANSFYARYLKKHTSPMPMEVVIKQERGFLDPGLYRDLLAASSRNPADGRAYLDFVPFFGVQVRTFNVRSVGCMMDSPTLGRVEMSLISGISLDRSSSHCLQVEMVKQNGGWQIKDVLLPSEERIPGAAAPQCGANFAYGRLSATLRNILSH